MNQFYKITTFVLLVFLIVACAGEEAEAPEITEQIEEVIPEEIVEEIRTDTMDLADQLPNDKNLNIAIFAESVINDDELSVLEYIDLPLKREAPIPAINTAEEFKAYFTTLFDAEIKEKLQAYLDAPDIIDLSGSNGTLGILNGLIWFNYLGNSIVSINYQSAAEKEKLAELEEKIHNSIHPILKDYEYNFFLGRTEDGLFRIDETEKGFRFASWYGDQNMASEPDFILWDGRIEKQGTAGGYTTIFDRVDTKYIFDQVDLCADPADCGLFLIVEDEGEITSKLEVTEVLDPFTEL